MAEMDQTESTARKQRSLENGNVKKINEEERKIGDGEEEVQEDIENEILIINASGEMEREYDNGGEREKEERVVERKDISKESRRDKDILEGNKECRKQRVNRCS